LVGSLPFNSPFFSKNRSPDRRIAAAMMITVFNIIKARGFAPSGILEYWNIGKMVFGMLPPWFGDPTWPDGED